MTPSAKNAGVTFVAGLGLLLPAALGLGLLGGSAPTMLAPLPALTLLPAFLLDGFGLAMAAVVVPTIFFFAWHPRLFRGETRVPKRSYALLAVATLLSAIDFVVDWKLGLKYHGLQYTYQVCIVDATWIAFLWFAFARNWKGGSSFKSSLFLHWMLFTWLAWYAFPTLGELP